MPQTGVRLVDVGGDADFRTTSAFVEYTIGSLTARRRRKDLPPLADVEIVRTRDRWIVQTAVDQPTAVLHIVAHGSRAGGRAAFTDEEERVTVHLDWLREAFEHNRSGIEAHVVFADACDTAKPAFMKIIRDLLQQPAIYIATSRSVDWWQATTFACAFYAAYFESTGHGEDPLRRGRDAAKRAVRAYKTLTSGDCPYEWHHLKPSEWAADTYDTTWDNKD